MSYADRLNKINSDYQKTDALKGSARSKPSDGDHHLRIDKAVLEESKKGKLKGLLQVVWHMTVVAGTDAGKKAFKRTTLEGKHSETGLGILKGDLDTLGVKLKNLRALTGKNGALRKVLGKIVLARVVTANDPRFYNVYFNELVEEMPEEGDLEAAGDDEFEEKEDEIDLDEEVVEEDEEEESESDESDDSDEDEEEEEEVDDTDPDNWSLDDVEAVDEK